PAEERFLAETNAAAGEPFGDFVAPQIERKGFQFGQQRSPNVAQRMPPSRQIVIDNDDLSTWPYDATKLAERSLAILAGLLMQQKEYEGTIVARIGQIQVAGIHCQQSHRRISGQFLAQIAELYWEHVDDVHEPAVGDACAQPSGQVTIGTCDLQRSSRQRISHFCHDRVTQPGVVSPKNKIDQPLTLEQLHRSGMNMRPPIVSI